MRTTLVNILKPSFLVGLILFLSCLFVNAQTVTRNSHLPSIINPVISESNNTPLRLFASGRVISGLDYDEVQNQTFNMPSYYVNNTAPRNDIEVYYDRSGIGPVVRVHYLPIAKIYDRYWVEGGGWAADYRRRKEVYLQFGHSLGTSPTIEFNGFSTLIPSAIADITQVKLYYKFILTQRTRRTGNASGHSGYEQPSTAFLDFRNESSWNEAEVFNIKSIEAKFIEINESLLSLTMCKAEGSINLYDYFTDKNGVSFIVTDLDGQQIATGNVVDLSALTAGDYKITASKTYINGSFSETIDFKLIDLPSNDITGTNSNVCEGETATISVAQAPTGVTYLYKWFRNNQIINGQTSHTITVNETGSYTAEITAEGSTCVTVTNPFSLTVNEAPIPTIEIQGNSVICDGESVVLTPSETGETYRWLNEEGEEVGTSQVLTVTKAGSYKVYVTYKNGCTAESAPVTITVRPNPKPLVQASGITEFCEGGSVSLVASLPDGFVAQSYKWSNGESGQTLNVTESGTYTVTVTNSQGCTNISDPIIVTVHPNPKPVITANGPLEFCDGSEVILTAPTANSYLWNNGDTTQSITVTKGGAFSVKTFTNEGCSNESDLVTVKVNPNVKPLIKAQSSTEFCEGESVVLQVTNAQPNTTYTWSNGESGLQTTVSTTQSVYVIASNQAGCSQNSEVIDVTVNPIQKPILSASGITEFCDGGTVTLTVVNAAGADSIRWSNGEVGASITVGISGNYYATIVKGDCERSSEEIEVKVTPNVLPIIQAQGLTTFCEGGSVTLQVTNPQPNTTYTWNNGETGQTLTTTTSGTYFVTASNQSGCSRTAEPIQVTVHPIQKPEILTSGVTEFCEGESVTLTVTNPAGADEIRWNNGEVGTSITVTTSGNYYATIIKGDCQRISDQISVKVNPNPKPIIEAIGSTDICQGETINLQVSNPQPNTTYTWSNGAEGLQTNVSTTGNYYVIASNQGNCMRNSDAISVTVNPIQKPNISLSSAPEFCEGSSITLTVTNPTGADEILWSNGETGNSIVVSTAGNYYAILKKGNCERMSDEIEVKVTPNIKPLIEAMGSTTICEGQTIVLQVTNPQPNVIYTWSDGTVGRRATISASGNYFVTSQNGNECSRISDNIAITVLPISKPTVSVDNELTICEGDSIVMTINEIANSYRWSNGATTKSITVKNPGNYIAYVSNGQCERASDPLSVTVNPNNKVVITQLGDLTFCEGDSLLLTVVNEGEYLWNTGATTRTLKITKSGKYSVQVTNDFDCISTSEIFDVTVNPLPKPTIQTTGTTQLCQGDSVILTINENAKSYRWSNGATTKSITVKNSGTYIAYISNDAGCERESDPINVTVSPNPVPQISIDGPTEFCETDSVVLYVNPIAGITYTWSNGQTGNSITVKNSGNYYVTSTTQNGCISISKSVKVTVHPLPKPTIKLSKTTTEFCEGDSIILTINETAKSYRWSNGETTKSITVKTSGDYVGYIINDFECERASDAVNITVQPNPTPIVNIIGKTEFCEGDKATLYVTPIAGITYVWSNGQQGNSITVTEGGSYYVTSSSQNGCTSISTTVEITVHPLPKPTINVSGQTEFCEGDSVTLTINETAESYRWSNGETTKSITVKNTGTYIGYIGNELDCERPSEAVNITVHPNPIPQINIVGETEFCEADSVILYVTPIAGITYTWSNGQQGNSIIVKNTGNYYVSSTTQNGCQAISKTVDVTVHPLPKPTVHVTGSTEFCEGDSVTLTINEIAKSYRWSNGATTKSIIVKRGGNYTAYIKNDYDCERASDPITINVNPNAKPTITYANLTACEGDSVKLTASNGASYLWSNGETTKEIYVSTPGQYSVTVTNTFGCYNVSDSVDVKIIPNPMPTITSDNGNNLCEGETTTLTASEGQFYKWSNGETTRTITVSTPGNYFVIVTNSNGCTRQSNDFELVVHKPLALNPIPDQQVCANGEKINLDEINTNPLGGIYEGEGVTFKTFDPNQVGPGTYKIKYTYTTEFGCISSIDFGIEVAPLDSLKPGDNIEVCLNSGDILLQVDGLPVGVEFEGNGVTGNLFKPEQAGVGIHEITYTFTNKFGCISTATRIITVTPLPTAPEVTGNMAVCNNTAITLVAKSTILDNSLITYNWYKEGELEPFATGQQIRYVVTKNEMLYVEAVSNKSCGSERTEVVILSYTPEVRLTASGNTIAQGSSVQFKLQDLPGSNPSIRWEYDFGDGFQSQERDPLHYYNKAGVYTVTVRAYSEQGCVAELIEVDYITVTENPIVVDPPVTGEEPIEDNNPFYTTIVYPNPIKQGEPVTLRTYNEKSGNARATLQVYTIAGTPIITQQLDLAPGQNEISIENLDKLTANTYYMFVVVFEDGKKEAIKVLVL